MAGYDPREVEIYIRQAAARRGMDPEIAVRVARSEGLRGYVGDNNSSFGPYQLHYGGVAPGGNRVGGLGDVFTKRTGLDARNPDTWRQQVDFSLDEAKRGGWTPWHGWKGDANAGLNGRGGATPVSAGSSATPSGVNLPPISTIPEAQLELPQAPGDMSLAGLFPGDTGDFSIPAPMDHGDVSPGASPEMGDLTGLQEQQDIASLFAQTPSARAIPQQMVQANVASTNPEITPLGQIFQMPQKIGRG